MTRLARSGGVHIAWEERGAGPPLVLIHGLGYGRWGWGPLLDRLAAHLRVIALDNRGIGESDAPPGPYTATQLSSDVLAVLDDAGVERAHVLGTSMGGAVAQELALTAPERVDRLVLLATLPGGRRSYPLPERTLRLMAEAPRLDLATAMRRFVANALAPDAPDALVDEIVAVRARHPQAPEAWQAQAAVVVGFDAGDRLATLPHPTLVVTGTEDGVVDPRNSDLLAELIPGARLERLPGVGHLAPWEAPERLAALVAGFVLGAPVAA